MRKKFMGGGLIPFLLWAGCAGPSHLDYPALQEPARGIYHEVQRGETLWRIAQSWHVSLDQIVSANKLSDPSRLQPGQLLFIPTASSLPTARSLPPPPLSKLSPGTLSFNWPMTGRVVSHFGQQTPLGRNKGIDLVGKEGNLVLAASAGTVSFAGEKVKGFGKTIILDHDQQYQTVYAHNQELLVKRGELVQKKQPIARMGRTGRVQEPTLHFEIRRGNRPLNPMDYLSRVP